jgi:hypothetical protein
MTLKTKLMSMQFAANTAILCLRKLWVILKIKVNLLFNKYNMILIVFVYYLLAT